MDMDHVNSPEWRWAMAHAAEYRALAGRDPAMLEPWMQTVLAHIEARKQARVLPKTQRKRTLSACAATVCAGGGGE